ncbi:MAG: hypothetical protein NTX03_14260 [Bacteroidetes bacterium]|nr:hypothetical protein [Bacteroidota bacterium]
MKTVYILGAGFSKPCGAPMQGEIISKILALPLVANLNDNQLKKIEALLERFTEFSLANLFTTKASLPNISLEDIFTPIDRCIIEDVSFRDVEPRQLMAIREDIYILISTAISQSIKTPHAAYIKKFVKHLISETQDRAQNPELDNIAVISTNWDIILDNELQRGLNKIKKPKEEFAGVVDYCCYVSSLKDDPRIKPGLYALGKGKFNVKLLKLHGSMNWLTCPRCQRLYTNFYENFQGVYLIKTHHCKHCERNFSGHQKESIKLRTNLIMPTFLKDLNNFQIKLIWQNAGIELSEADRVVFIGYSLPQADFELRQLLSRMLKKEVKIRVILSKYDLPQKGVEHFYAGYRFQTFFSNKNIDITYEGVEEFVMEGLNS